MQQEKSFFNNLTLRQTLQVYTQSTNLIFRKKMYTETQTILLFYFLPGE